MHIVVGVVRDVVIEHVADVRDVQAARGDVRGYKNLEFARAEVGERLHAQRLVQVAVDRRGVEAVGLQRLGDDVDFRLAIAEDDAVLHVVATDQGAQGGALGLGVRGGDADDILGDGVGCHGRPRGLDPGRILEELRGQARDLGRHGGREEQGLALGRRQFEDALDVGDETHVEHAVGFVDDHHLDAGQQDLAAFEQIEQTARRGDQDVDALVQQRHLVAHGDSADQQSPAQLGALGVFCEVLGDLVGQFAGGGQDQGARHPGAGATRAETVDHRQGEGGGLAGAGLGDAQDVTAGQGHRNGGGLNGGGFGVARIGDRLQGRGRKAQLGEFCHATLRTEETS
ncbi:hypothetical protein D3C87_924220 [compost metagenome]